MHDLVKPELPVAAGVCVVAGEVIASGSVPEASVGIHGFLAGFFISGTAMITNDYFDLEVDRVNHPARPLPSGRISAVDWTALCSGLLPLWYSLRIRQLYLSTIIFVIVFIAASVW
ncbi:UbiA family prenyltransferase [Methanothrix sp.]|uniref:UbiA family prenyltransferase n=1 Tax=Methanothrix sp. TaxID=90426 RepID=UPI003297037F